MNNLKTVGMNNMFGKLLQTISKGISLVKEKKMQALLLAYAVFAPINTAYAADAKWNAVIDFILPWITRLGGVVILIGAVEFALAIKNDDADTKTKGMKTIIAGCVVFAVGLSSGTFLY